jgi:FkbM family methyltransferase
MASRFSPKALLRHAARAAGFEILRTRVGLDPDRDLVRLVGQGAKTIFDVGANVGQTAVTLATLFPAAKVHSFEPDRDVFATLETNVRDRPNVSPHAMALSDSDAAGTLFVTHGSEGSSLLPLAKDVGSLHLGAWTESREQKPVRIARLDSFCATHGIASIDLLKSDTQGNDLKVLEGAGAMLAPPTIRTVFCEVLFAPLYEGQCYFDDVHRLLVSRGYRLVGFYNETRDASHRLMWCDALYN